MTSPLATTLVVGISDCKVTKNPDSVLVTYALGSCIAVVLYDPLSKVSGMLHYMLPESGIDAGKAERNPFMFADTGISGLLAAVTAQGGTPKRMLVRLAGGAQVLDSQGVFQIGKRNYLAARKILWKAGILIAAEAVGGEAPQTIRLEVGTGKLWIREGGGIERELLQQRAPQKQAPERGLANGVLCADRG